MGRDGNMIIPDTHEIGARVKYHGTLFEHDGWWGEVLQAWFSPKGQELVLLRFDNGDLIQCRASSCQAKTGRAMEDLEMPLPINHCLVCGYTFGKRGRRQSGPVPPHERVDWAILIREDGTHVPNPCPGAGDTPVYG